MNVLRFVLKGQLMGVVEVRNMYEYSSNSVWADGDSAAILEHLGLMFEDVKAVLSSNFSYYGVEIYKRSEGAWESIFESQWLKQGDDSSPFATYQTAAVINGTVDGFKSHARKFIAGLGDDIPFNGRIPLVALLNFAAFAVDWLLPVTATSGNTYRPGVLGKGEIWHDLVGTEAMAVLGTIRRRKPGYGI